MAIHVGYEPAASPSGGAPPGSKALMAWYLGAYASRGNPRPANLGIHVVKRVTSSWSLHAEGRACDLGTSPYSAPRWGKALADALVANSAELGVQCVIFNRLIWSGAYPHAGWRRYNGSNPHTGHLHVELSRAAARSLTAVRVQEALGSTKTTNIARPAGWVEEIIMSLPTLRRGSRGNSVRRLQGLLHAAGHRSTAIDGEFGAKTDSAVRAFQTASAPPVDGIVGRVTWTKLIRG